MQDLKVYQRPSIWLLTAAVVFVILLLLTQGCSSRNESSVTVSAKDGLDLGGL
jgi:hypothetical protein